MKKILLALSLPILLSACDNNGENTPKIDAVNFSSYTSLTSLYTGKIKTTVDAKCTACHVKGKKAGNTSLLFVSNDDVRNVAALQNFITTKSGDRLVSKPIGRRHGGGAQIASGGVEAQALTEFASRVAANSQ